MASPAAPGPPESLDFPSAVERFLYDARGLGRLLQPVVREIRETTEAGQFVLPGTRWVHRSCGYVPVERPERPCDRKTIWRTVRRVGRRARIGTSVHPHQLRHAFADRVTRLAGLHAAQALLGHASIQTTEGYLTKPSPDELLEAMARVTLGVPAAEHHAARS